MIQICISIFEPNNVSLFDPFVAVNFFVETVDGTAQGIVNLLILLYFSQFKLCNNNTFMSVP